MAKHFVVVQDDDCPYCTAKERREFTAHGIKGRKACKERHDRAEAARRATLAKQSSKKGGKK